MVAWQRWEALDCERLRGTARGRRHVTVRLRSAPGFDLWAWIEWLFDWEGHTDPEQLAVRLSTNSTMTMLHVGLAALLSSLVCLCCLML